MAIGIVSGSSFITLGQNLSTKCMITLTFWICCYAFDPISSTPWTGSNFGLIFLFVTSYCVGYLSSLVGLPSIVGILCTGIVLANFNFTKSGSGSQALITLDPHVSTSTRNLALAVILLRAGLSLNPVALRKLSWVCLRLAFCPCILEACTLALVNYYLIGIPFAWSMVIGFVCVAVSPAIIVPSMISLQKQGLGTDKGIPTLAIGGSSIDDVIAITGFELFLGLAMSTVTSTSLWSIVLGPIEAVSGLILGTALGLLFWFLPPASSFNPKSNLPITCQWSSSSSSQPFLSDHTNKARLRLFLLLFTGIGFIFLTKTLTIESLGPLGTLSVAFVAGLRWREEGYLDYVTSRLKDVWFFCEIFLFALIGFEVHFISIDYSTLLWCLVCLIIGLLIRTLITFSILFGTRLSIKEKLFIAITWLPKGTVQAAVGSIPLELARSRQEPQSIEYGLITLNYAVLSIIITAPLGAWLIKFFSKRTLIKSTPQQSTSLESNRDISSFIH